MASKLTPAKRLKKLSKEIPDDSTNRLSMLFLATESNLLADRALALVGGTLVEKALEVAILSKLVNLSEDDRKRLFEYDHNGPLATFDARIKMAAALGIMGPKTTRDLDIIRTVRNAFAHPANNLSFDNEDVAHLCRELYIPSTISLLGRHMLGEDEAEKPRGLYVEAVLALASRLKISLEKMGVSGAFINRWYEHLP